LSGFSDDDDGAPFEFPASGSPSALDLTLQREQTEQISAGMQQLTATYREALVLRFQEEMRLEEIASVTGLPISTVKSRIYRALTALQPWLKGARR
jgi:RNA polymerase sigma-70 factor (ECF subfamily)